MADVLFQGRVRGFKAGLLRIIGLQIIRIFLMS